MTPMNGGLDWLAVGDAAEERAAGDSPGILGGGAARLVAHAAALRARTALVAKVGEDDAGRRVRDALERLRVDLRWLRDAPDLRTTIWHQPDGEPQLRRLERGADLALRLDELPSISVRAALTVVSGLPWHAGRHLARPPPTRCDTRSRFGGRALPVNRRTPEITGPGPGRGCNTGMAWLDQPGDAGLVPPAPLVALTWGRPRVAG